MKTTTVEIQCDFCNKSINPASLAKQLNIKYKENKVMLKVDAYLYGSTFNGTWGDICINCVNDALKQYCKELD